jgi:hypothetical protein
MKLDLKVNELIPIAGLLESPDVWVKLDSEGQVFFVHDPEGTHQAATDANTVISMLDHRVMYLNEEINQLAQIRKFILRKAAPPEYEEPPDYLCAYPGCSANASELCGDCNGRYCSDHHSRVPDSFHGKCTLCQQYEEGKPGVRQYSMANLVFQSPNDLVKMLNKLGLRGWKLVTESTTQDKITKTACSLVLLMRERL